MIRALLAGVSVVLIMATPVSAERAARAKPQSTAKVVVSPKKATTSATASSVGTAGASQDCVRALAADPGGRYASYPCWARAGLGVDVTSD